MDSTAIRRELRHSQSSSIRRRRLISALCAVGAADFIIISLFQFGVIRHLPDPPGRGFASDQVNASPKAIILGIPDGPIGLGLYAFIMLLAGAQGERRRHPIWDLLLGGSILAGAAGSADYLRDMIKNQQRACPYCLVGAATHFTMLPLVAPLVRTSLRSLISANRSM